MTRGRGLIKHIIREGIDAGEFRNIPVEDFPQIVMGPGMMGAIWVHHFNHLSPIDLDALYDAHMDLLMNGLRCTD